MKVSKFKVLLNLKKSSLDKQGKAPIMGRITLNNSMAQFSCKLSCTPNLWNPRSGRLDGKSKEAVETNAKIEHILLSVNSAVDNLKKRNIDFTATTVKEMMQGSVNGQVTLLQVNLWLKYKRKKTGVHAMVKLIPEAIALFDKYKTVGLPTLMPRQNYAFLLKNLKTIAEMAGCTQPITHHMGRHYYASILTLSNDVPIDVISKMLGHTNVRMTQVYAMVTQDKLFEEVDKFIEATKDFVLVLNPNCKELLNK